MKEGYRKQPQVLIWYGDQDALISGALKQLSLNENEAVAANDGSMEESGCFTADTLLVKWLCCSRFDFQFQKTGTAGLPLPVIGLRRCLEIEGVVLVESPRQNDMLRLCVEDGLKRSGVICQNEKAAAGVMTWRTESFSPLTGTAVYLLVGDINGADLVRLIKLVCGFLERRLDAVRCEIAQSRNGDEPS